MVKTMLQCWVCCTSYPPPDRTQVHPTPYIAIVENELVDTQIGAHVDANNEGFSDFTAFGRFTGGSLVLEGFATGLRAPFWAITRT
eukprot:3724435-Amphidinium_carterae.1